MWSTERPDGCDVPRLSEARATEARKCRRFAVPDNIVAAAVVAIFILVAWWQEFRRDAWEWKVWLGVTVWYLVMWAFAKSR